MTPDIAKLVDDLRLISKAISVPTGAQYLCVEAADALTRLSAEREVLKKLLATSRRDVQYNRDRAASDHMRASYDRWLAEIDAALARQESSAGESEKA